MCTWPTGASPPPNANMLAFGNLGVQGGYLSVQGWLYDTKNAQSPQVLGKQYREEANDDNARLIAHRFADEIIFRLGGGVPGIAETKIYFVSSRGGSKEIWQMDYDGANQKQTDAHWASIALVAARLARRYAGRVLRRDQRRLADPDVFAGSGTRWSASRTSPATNYSPAWSSDGQNTRVLVLAQRQHRDLYASTRSGGNPRRLTENKGPGCFADLEPED